MIIDGNEQEIEAMRLMHEGKIAEGEALQADFVAQFREAYADKDHCSCKTKRCPYHGRCKECVAIHRAHREHVPNCLRSMLNERIRALSALTEHTVAPEIIDRIEK